MADQYTLNYNFTKPEVSASRDTWGTKNNENWQKLDTVLGNLSAIPPGGIIMWSGTIASIPEGWALCDGNNGTPDLREKFIMGAGTTAPKVLGGAATHTHAIGGTALTTAQLPSHSHTISGGGAHTHSYNYISNAGQSYTVQAYSSGTGVSVARTLTQSTANTGSGGSSSSSTGTAGSGSTHTHTIGSADNRPPYMALAFIMKL